MSSDHRSPGWQTAVLRFAHHYGWWRVFAIPVLTVITILVFVDILRPEATPDSAHTSGAYSALDGVSAGAGGTAGDSAAAAGGAALSGANSSAANRQVGPDPANNQVIAAAKGTLPDGGPFTERGEKTYREVGTPGKQMGQGTEKVVRYSTEVEKGINMAAVGGDDAFAAVVDATLADPRSWINEPRFKFIHVRANEHPDTRIRLTSLATTAELCGVQVDTETSCHTTITGESTVVINEARWIRGATPFEGDLGNYRQYLINHEFGHAIGYATHQPCGAQGALAPIMMQQTISLNNSDLAKLSPTVYPLNNFVCESNPWPYPQPLHKDVNNPIKKAKP